MKILHITASYKPAYIYGGPIASVSKLCESISLLCLNSAQDDITEGAKLELQVLTTTANGKAELGVKVGKPILVYGAVVTYFKRWTKDHSHFSPGLLWRLRKVLRHFDKLSAGITQHDSIKIVIHIHAWWNLVSVLSCLVAKWHKVPVVLSPRGMLTSYTQGDRNSFSKKILHKIIGKSLLKYVHVHATSEQEKLEVLKLVQPKSISVIPNLVTVPMGEFRGLSSEDEASSSKYQVASSKYQEAGNKYQEISSEDQVDRSVFNLIFLSRIEEKKGLELLFEALSAVNFDYRLTIAGTGDENYIKSLKLKAESLKLGKRIKWIGQVRNDEKFSMMDDHDLLVLPSYNENFANVVIESLSVGTPVLVSKNVGLADYVKANTLGWVCSLEPKDIAEKINLAYNETLKRETIKLNAPILIKNDFDDKVLVRSYLELYERVLRQSQHDMV